MAEPFVQIKVDEKSLKEAERILRAVPRAFPKVMSRATLRTANFAKTRYARIIAKELKIKVGEAKNYIWIIFIPPYGRKIEVSNYTHPVIKLDARQEESGVSHAIYKGSKKRNIIEHAFIATGATRGRQVWLRSRYYMNKNIKYITWKGRHMEAIYFLKSGKSPYRALFAHLGDLTNIQEATALQLQKEINSAMSFALKKWAN